MLILELIFSILVYYAFSFECDLDSVVPCSSIYLQKNYHINQVNASFSNEFIKDVFHFVGVNSLIMSRDMVYCL